MGQFVRVESFAALQKFRTALCKCAERLAVGLDEADAELQRVDAWVKHDQAAYWKREGAKRAELYQRAKSDLARKKLQKTALGNRYSCVDEQKALARAERQLDEAKQKAANVRRWSRLLDEESFTYKAVAQGLGQAVALDLPNALAQLDNMLTALEAYADTATPQLQRSVADAGDEQHDVEAEAETPSNESDRAAENQADSALRSGNQPDPDGSDGAAAEGRGQS